MGDVLGLGLAHYRLLLAKDEFMAALLASSMKDSDIPADAKDPKHWSEQAQREWSDDNGAAAAERRAHLRGDLDRICAALDEFDPDVMIVWGDGQYENFREEVIPSFCVLAYNDTKVDSFGVLDRMHLPNAWELPDGQSFVMQGAPDVAKRLATDLINSGIDVAAIRSP
jgi:hypothetical protein